MCKSECSKPLRLQSAMEYLMTYGWSILIIAVVLGALFQLGVFNSSSFSPRAPPGACQVFRPGGPGTITNINLMGVCTGQLPQYVGVFNGQTGRVNLGNAASLNLASTMTLSAWAYTAQAPTNYEAIIGKRSSGEAYSLEITTNNRIRFAFYGAVGHELFSNNDAFPLGNWFNVVGTYDGSTQNIYINGVSIKSTSTSDYISTISYPVGIGTLRGDAVAVPFNGLLANVQIYNTSLTANQVQALYLQGIGGAPMKLQNLVGWWPLNGNPNDYSGNNNNGVPTAVTFTSQYGK